MVIGLKKWKKLILCLFCMLFLAGCGKDEALDVYQKDMETFFEHMAEFDENMNAIDVGQEDYVAQLLSYLDALDAEVAWMAELEVPEQFSAVDNLADEASENMRQAVSYFHMAYEAKEFMPNYEEAAREYYKRANLRIQYIIMLLHGEIPEGDNITYTEENRIFGGGYLNKTDDDSEDSAETEASGEPESGTGESTQE